MSSASRAVFLSYASQDADAARRICDALRAAGVEVWFDQSELRGGDAWDAKIRKQIAECALFVPIISANTQARREGYFRIEWRLAAQRTHAMSDDTTFLLPVVIDDTSDTDARVPPEFKAVQWTRLPGGEAAEKFCARVQTLLGGSATEPERARGDPAPGRTSPGAPSEDAASPANANSGTRRRSPAAVWVAVAFFVAALGGLFAWRRNSAPAPAAASGSRGPATAASAPAAITDKSIAVLPFANLSDDRDNAYFADGMHEDTLTALANIPELRIVSRKSVQRYRDTKKPAHEIARELGVAYILEGSVRRAGGTVRVTGQLIRAATDEHVWAQHYDRELKDVFAIQAALATEMAQALRAAIDPAQRARLNRAATQNPAAYDRLLRARAVLNAMLVVEQPRLEEAEAHLRSAVELDPGFAVAWSYLGDVQAQLYFHGHDRTEARRGQARAAIERAQQLDPDHSEVLRNCGAYYYHAWRDFARAGEYYRRALELQPNNSETHLRLALQLRRLGDWPGVLATARRAFELDATVQARALYIGTMLRCARRYDEAHRILESLAQRESNPLGLVRQAPGLVRFFATGSTRAMAEYLDRLPDELKSKPEYLTYRQQIALFDGDWAEAWRLAEAHRLPWDSPILKASLQITLGRADQARRELADMLENLTTSLQRWPDDPIALRQRAMAAALLGRNSDAREYLRQAQATILATNDKLEAADLEQTAAFVLLWTGDKDGALRELARNLARPGPLADNVHEMRRSPRWAPLHDDPRFAQLLNDPKNNAQVF